MLLRSWKHGFTHAFDFSSTTGRATFWYWVLANFLILLVLNTIDVFVVRPLLGFSAYDEAGGEPLAFLYSLASLLPSLSIGVRRLRDGGYTPWLMALSLLPLLNLVLIYFFVQPTKAQEQSGN